MTESTLHPSIKPWPNKVKWYIAGGLVLIIGGLQLGTYYLGRSEGYEEGYAEGKRFTPEYVIQQSDEKALNLLAEFMADTAKSPESLATLLQNRKERLDWVRDEQLKREVSWGLARELMQRGGFNLASASILEVLNDGLLSSPNKTWANRAYSVAKELQSHGNTEDALLYLNKAADLYGKEEMIQEQMAMFNVGASILLIRGEEAKAMKYMDQAVLLCDKLPKELKDLEKPRILAMKGRVARLSGQTEVSREHFQKALSLCPDLSKFGQVEGLATACLGMGEAMLEAKRFDEANTFFQRSIDLIKQSNGDIKESVNALRGLALIAAINHQEALAKSYLDQAQGIALISIEKNDAMWPNLYDQRGWISLRQQNHELAKQDFKKSLSHDSASLLVKTQSLEGLGQTSFELSQPKEAVELLNQALENRLSSFKEDQSAIAQVAKKLGMAYDMLGETQKAWDAYAIAVKYASELKTETGRTLLIPALLAKAYASMELKKWAEASECFETVIPLLTGEQKSETYKQLAKCYDEQNLRSKGDECWRLSGFPRVKSGK